MEDTGCIYTGRKWFCPNDCDDPTHGKSGPSRLYYHGRYYRPGQLIIDNE